MKKGLFRKGLVFGIIILLIGVNIALTTDSIDDIFVSKNYTSGYLYAIHTESTGEGDFYCSKDEGLTWEIVGSVGIGNCFAMTSDYRGYLYTISHSNGNVYRSTDKGLTWEHIGVTNSDCRSMTSDINGSLYIISRSSGFVFRSVDGGFTWEMVKDLPYDHYHGITSDINGYIYTIDWDYGYVRRSKDGGFTWENMGTGPVGCECITSDINGYIYTINWDTGLTYKSIDNGSTWYSGGYASDKCYGITSDINGSLYTIIWDSGDVYSSIDEGNSWQNVGNAAEWCGDLSFCIWPPADFVLPEISNVKADPWEQFVDGYVNISASVIDNIIVDEVYLNISYSDNFVENFSIKQNKTSHNYYCNRTYHLPGEYSFHIWAKDNSAKTNISDEYTFFIINSPPNAPTITGQTNGNTETSYPYLFNSTDPDGDDVKYIINWGDNTSEWTGYNPSGTDVTVNHTWSNDGKYNITAKAQDINGAESNWTYFDIEIETPRNRATYPSMFYLLFERFPLLERLLGLIRYT